MDVKRGHRRLLQREIATAKGIPPTTPLLIDPLYSSSMKDDIVETPGGNSRMSSVGTSSGIGFSQTSSSGGRETSNSASNGRSSVSSTEEDNGISDSPVTEHKRKYRRHAKPDKNAPVKPPSAYVRFSNKVRAELKDQNMSFTDLAKIVGDRWKAISPEEKEAYETAAARAKEDYQAALSSYEQTEDHKTYQQYLSEFKAKQEAAGK
ncbi:high mobility group box domain-containing protein [Jimgerdemannia flammicorona]|uniref:High mobility group box domain-containing protein n=1 Tax=Jimgerdemannia flammicorona TaxID=994334 RepID=A0A433CX83_9FUNG|nr:high mobility group box domain-containing protein [Jimgerdemannia flammicorona]